MGVFSWQDSNRQTSAELRSSTHSVHYTSVPSSAKNDPAVLSNLLSKLQRKVDVCWRGVSSGSHHTNNFSAR